MALCIGLPKGPRGELFIMSEAPLYLVGVAEAHDVLLEHLDVLVGGVVLLD